MADFWTEYGKQLTDLAILAGGITAYTLVVTWLYVPMGTRLMFAKRFGEKAVATPGRRFLYVLLFPLVSFGFFLVVGGSMLFLSSPEVGGSNLTQPEILTISMALVLAIRVAAYFHEDGAQEVAKVMPLGLLGVVLVTGQFNSLGQSLANGFQGLQDNLALILVFFLVVVVVEFLLRGIYELAGRPGGKRAKGPGAPARAPNQPVANFQRRP